MEKKKNGIVIALIVVIVLLLSYIGYISFFKVTNKNETVTSDKKKVDTGSKDTTTTKDETLRY